MGITSKKFYKHYWAKKHSSVMDFWIRGELIVVEDVPAGVCPQCGEKVVKANVGRWIAKLLENTERIAEAPRISVPTIKFDIRRNKHYLAKSFTRGKVQPYSSFVFVSNK